MPRIRYERRHSLPFAEAKTRLVELMDRFAKKYGFSTAWEQPERARVRGRGVSGSLELRGDQVVVDLDLSLLLSPLKTRIADGIARQIDQALP